MRPQKAGKFLLSNDAIQAALNEELEYDDLITEKSNPFFEWVFDWMLENSTIEKLSQKDEIGQFGLIYKLTLKENVESPYVKLHISESMPPKGNLGQKICSADTFYRKPCFQAANVFLIKLSFLEEDGPANRNLAFNKHTDTVANFKKEAEIQNTIYEKTFELGESIVPACSEKIIIRKIYEPVDRKKVLVSDPTIIKLANPKIDTDSMLVNILKGAGRIGVNLYGCILMEFAEGFRTFSSIVHDPTLSAEDKSKAYAFMRLGHLILYQNLYWHGDCHLGNVMINLDYTGFLSNGEKGKVFMIDFGRAEPIPQQMLNSVENLILQTGSFEPVFRYVSLASKLMATSGLSTPKSYYKKIEEFTGAPGYDFIRYENIHRYPPHFSANTFDIVKLLVGKMKRKNRLLQLINSATPNSVKRDFIFAGFLQNPNFHNLNYIRWKDFIESYKPEANGTLAPEAQSNPGSAATAAASSAQSNPGNMAPTVEVGSHSMMPQVELGSPSIAPSGERSSGERSGPERSGPERSNERSGPERSNERSGESSGPERSAQEGSLSSAAPYVGLEHRLFLSPFSPPKPGQESALSVLRAEGNGFVVPTKSAIDLVIEQVVSAHPEIQEGGKQRKKNRRKTRKNRSRK